MSFKTLLVSLFSFFSVSLMAQKEKQIKIETKIVEVKESAIKELGFEFGMGPTFSLFTHDNQNMATGINVQGGVNMRFNDYIGLGTDIFYTQYGGKNTFGNLEIKNLINVVGVQSLASVCLHPGKVEPEISLGIRLGANTGGVIKTSFDGDKDKQKFNLTNNDNRFFAGVTTGITTTIRTNAGDLELGLMVTGGLTTLNENISERRVPVLFEIPFIYRFFGLRENTRNRENLLILVHPQIIEDPD